MSLLDRVYDVLATILTETTGTYTSAGNAKASVASLKGPVTRDGGLGAVMDREVCQFVFKASVFTSGFGGGAAAPGRGDTYDDGVAGTVWEIGPEDEVQVIGMGEAYTIQMSRRIVRGAT